MRGSVQWPVKAWRGETKGARGGRLGGEPGAVVAGRCSDGVMLATAFGCSAGLMSGL